MAKSVFLQLAALFLITQILGLMVANGLIKENIKATIVTENPEDIENALGLFAYIITITVVVLIIISFKRASLLLFILELSAIFATSVIVFGILLPEIAGMLAILLLSLRILLKDSILIRNIACLIAVAGAGSLIGVSLGVLPVVLFIAILAIYDYVAVFKTKHMVKIAKTVVKEKLAFTFSIPGKNKVYQLGTGDLVMPLVFVTSVMNKAKQAIGIYATIPIIATIMLASLLGLLATLYYSAKKRKALPALPLQTLYMLIAWASFLALGAPVL